MKIIVKGEPYPFATNGEKSWKSQLISQIPQALPENEIGVSLVFNFAPEKHNGYFDLDNACEPVFSILVNNKGWFGGQRQNILWWEAKKFENKNSQCEIKIKNISSNFKTEQKKIIFDQIYTGALPKNSSDENFLQWIYKNNKFPRQKSKLYEITIQFERKTINLGDIATGSIKSIIDCLFPIYGGVKGKPEDYKITKLQIEKGVTLLPMNSVRIVVCES